jgi:hypothetical protein
VYGNRRRIHGEHGKQLLRSRGEFLERSFAHAYETGGMWRVYLRGRENVYKRVLIHLGGFNLSLVMRQWLGKGTPRGWQGFSADTDGVAVLDCDPGCCTGKQIAPKPQTLSCCARHYCDPTGGAVTKTTSATGC